MSNVAFLYLKTFIALLNKGVYQLHDLQVKSQIRRELIIKYVGIRFKTTSISDKSTIMNN